MNSLSSIHPNIVLLEEFLKFMSISFHDLSEITEIQQTHIFQFIRSTRHITPCIPLRLGILIDMYANFWIKLLNKYDLLEGENIISNTLQEVRNNQSIFSKLNPYF